MSGGLPPEICVGTSWMLEVLAESCADPERAWIQRLLSPAMISLMLNGGGKRTMNGNNGNNAIHDDN